MMTTGHIVETFTGHDPDTHIAGFPGEGCDLLLTIWDNGGRDLAVRPGNGVTSRVWGPPTDLVLEPAEVCS